MPRARAARSRASVAAARRRVEQLGGGNDAIHEPDAICLGGIDHLTGQQQLQRAALPDETRQSLRAAVAGQMPSFTSGWPNFAASTRDADVTRHRELAAAAEREAVDCGDDRLGRRLEAAEYLLTVEARAASLAWATVRRAREMSAPAMNARPAPVRMRRTDIVALADLVDRLAQLADRRGVQAFSLSGRLTVIVATRSATESSSRE